MSCLPFLRALLANIIRSGVRTILGYKSNPSGGPTKKTNQDYTLDTFQGKSKAFTTTSGHHMRHVSANGSEEAILHDDNALGGGIVKTTQVYVQEEEVPRKV